MLLSVCNGYGKKWGWQYYSLKIDNNENILYFSKKRRIFYNLQLVCEGHLRSFTGKTYVRLRATLTYAYGQHMHTLVSKAYVHL